MADDMTQAPTSGNMVAADRVDDVLYPRVKISVGEDGGPLVDLSAANPMPVSGSVVAATAPVTVTTATGQISSSGDNTIVAAPSAGSRIRVYELQLQLEAATATTAIVKSGSTAIRRAYMAAAADGVLWQWFSGQELVLAEASALVVNLSGANAVGYTVRYAVETV